MSHFTVVKPRLSAVKIELLERVLEVIAEKLGCEVVKNGHVVDFVGRVQTVDYVLTVPGPGRAFGIGIRVLPSGVEIVGDAFGREELFRQVEQMLVQYYTALAVVEAARKIGMKVENVIEVSSGASQPVIVIDLVR